MGKISLLVLRLGVALSVALSTAAAARRRDDRGDVPGWVLVTVMSVGLVGVIWKAAGSQLTDMLTTALASVKG